MTTTQAIQAVRAVAKTALSENSYVTSDRTVFGNESSAKNHAKTLDNKEVVKVTAQMLKDADDVKATTTEAVKAKSVEKKETPKP